MRNYTYPSPGPCDPEWTSRSLTELVTHLSVTYRRATRQRIDVIRVLLRRVWPFDEGPRHADLGRLANIFDLLDDAVDQHIWLEADVLCPAIVRLERPGTIFEAGACDALRQMVMMVADEHRRIRTILGQLARAVCDIPTASLPLPCEQALLVSDLEMLGLILNEQMDLEDRCLWSRALDLFNNGHR